MKTSPLLGLTVGDRAGVGPEIVASVLHYLQEHPAFLHGCEVKVLGNPTPSLSGYPTSATSREAIDVLEEVSRSCLAGKLAAVVTGPVHKHRLHAEGFAFPGQTEFFAARAGVDNVAMLLTGGSLTVALVTAHIPLSEVSAALSVEEIVRVGKLLVDFLAQRGMKYPRLAVAGLNPHAGEEGDLGKEEQTIITPAVNLLCQIFPQASIVGPMSPDTVFWQASQGTYDAVLCMYHDQGLIPLKLHAFDLGVNVTLGLPFLRTSPDHGTAYQIAGKGIASPQSYLAAVKLAVEFISRKTKV